MRDAGRRIWVTRAIGSDRLDRLESPFLRSLLLFAWLPVGLTAGLLLLADAAGSGTFLLAQGFATLLLVVVPYLIWYYDDRVKPTFYERALRVVEDGAAFEALAADCDRRFARRYRPVTAAWTLLLVALYVASDGFLASLGISGVADPAYWLYLAFFVWGAVLTGIGFHGILTTVLCIRRLAEDVPLSIDPLAPDNLGGLSSVGYFAIWTTLLASVGSLLFPLAFAIASFGGFELLVYLAVAVYVLFMVLSFVYPTVKVNRQAQRLRDSVLDDLRRSIDELRAEVADGGSAVEGSEEEIARQLEIQRLREEYEDYRDVRLYPMSVDVLARLVGSVLLPLAFLGLEIGVTVAFG